MLPSVDVTAQLAPAMWLLVGLLVISTLGILASATGFFDHRAK